MMRTKWRTAALAAMLTLGSAIGAAHAIPLANPVGAACEANTANVNVFVTAIDGTVKSRSWSGSWGWTDHGLASTGTASGVGVVHAGIHPFAFSIGNDGNLWSRDRNFTTTGWAWLYHGAPPGASIAMSVGATVHRKGTDDYRPLALVVGSDGNLWGRGLVDSGWNWDNLGMPSGASIAKPAGAITVKSPQEADWRPYGFVIGNDGNLWSAWWDGVWSWTNHGSPPGGVASGVGAVSIASGERPFVFVIGNDGNLWSRSWSGSAWAWHNHGLPGGQAIANGMGVTSASSNTRPFAFVKGADGSIWSNDWTGSAWRWHNHGTPSGVSVGASVGATAVNTSNPYLFFLGSDGNLWLRWWSGSAWGWHNHGQP